MGGSLLTLHHILVRVQVNWEWLGSVGRITVEYSIIHWLGGRLPSMVRELVHWERLGSVGRITVDTPLNTG